MIETFTLPLYLSAGVLTLGLVLVTIGFLKRIWLILGIGVVIVLVGWPVILNDKLVVTDERVHQDIGFWAELDFVYDEIESFSVNVNAYTDGSKDVWWNIKRIDGARDVLYPSWLWKKHTPFLLKVIAEHGFEETEMPDWHPDLVTGQISVRFKQVGLDKKSVSGASEQ